MDKYKWLYQTKLSPIPNQSVSPAYTDSAPRLAQSRTPFSAALACARAWTPPFVHLSQLTQSCPTDPLICRCPRVRTPSPTTTSGSHGHAHHSPYTCACTPHSVAAPGSRSRTVPLSSCCGCHPAPGLRNRPPSLRLFPHAAALERVGMPTLPSCTAPGLSLAAQCPGIHAKVTGAKDTGSGKKNMRQAGPGLPKVGTAGYCWGWERPGTLVD